MAGVMTFSRSPSMKRLVAHLSKPLPDDARTVVALAASCHMGVTTVHAVLRALRNAGEAHVSTWLLHGVTQMRVPVWALGAGEDAPRPGPKQGRHEVNAQTSPGGRRVMAWFREGNSGSWYDVARASALASRSARVLCKQLHAEGMLRITSWLRSHGGAPTPVFGLRCKDSKPDAPMPRRLTRAELWARRRDRVIARFGEKDGRALWRAMTSTHNPRDMVVIEGRVVYRRGEGVLLP